MSSPSSKKEVRWTTVFDVSVTGVRRPLRYPSHLPPPLPQPWMPSSTSNQLFLAMSIKLQASWPPRHSASVHLSMSVLLKTHTFLSTTIASPFIYVHCFFVVLSFYVSLVESIDAAFELCNSSGLWISWDSLFG